MKTLAQQKSKETSAVERARQELAALWPALKGSLAQVHKPCIRKNCPACARGDRHPAWLLAFSERGRRRCLYVPTNLVPQLQQALRNGRKIEKLLYRLGPLLIREYRRQRQAHTAA
jgi:hypothetical protein